MTKQEFKLLMFRASIFVPNIAYNNENLRKVLNIPEFSEFTPNFMPAAQIPISNPFIQAPVANFWEIISPNKAEHICFVENKIDININIDSKEYNLNDLKYHGKYCALLFSKLLSTFGFLSSRMAIAPTFALKIDGNQNVEFARRFFRKSFLGSEINSCTFSNVYRVNKNINDKNYIINYVCNFNNGQFLDVKQQPNLLYDTIVMALDINTFVDVRYIFKEEDINSFFDISPDWVNEYVDFFCIS